MLSLTGRSTNAWLLDGAGELIDSLREGQSDPPPIQDEETNRQEATPRIDESVTHEQVLERFFGSSARFGPVLKREFIARSSELGAAGAHILGRRSDRASRFIWSIHGAEEQIGQR